MHIPVLLDEVIQNANPKKGMIFVDGTLGRGGHAASISQACQGDLTIIGFDKDGEAIALSRSLLEKKTRTAVFFNTSFESIAVEIEKLGIAPDAILLDLGLSSPQLDSSGRGFSFMKDEPLQMTMVHPITPDTLTARDIVNDWSLESLTDIIRGYGEERYAWKIANAIVAGRQQKPFVTTYELRDAILAAVPASYRKGKVHPATRTFQAIRIAVNDELATLERTLPEIEKVLASGGRLLVISFHSLEDRIVKNFFKKSEEEERGRRITKKPIVPTESEVKKNPRARSAKLRVYQKN